MLAPADQPGTVISVIAYLDHLGRDRRFLITRIRTMEGFAMTITATTPRKRDKMRGAAHLASPIARS